MSRMQKLDLKIETDVLTSGSTAEIVNAILEFLLYQRNQIPFVYKIYKTLCERWSSDEQATDVAAIQNLCNFQLQRQREQATHTRESISAMRQLINKSFDDHAIKCVRFLFGATTFTPKEVYTIHIPTLDISRRHCHEQHRIPHASLNQTLLSLLTCENLYKVFSHNLCPTNLYLEFELLDGAQHCNTKAKIFPKDISQLPPSCKDIHLHLMHTQPLSITVNALHCCKDLQVFEDLLDLRLDEATAFEENIQKNKNVNNCLEPTWWEADVIVRGFKEKPIKGLSIWNN